MWTPQFEVPIYGCPAIRTPCHMYMWTKVTSTLAFPHPLNQWLGRGGDCPVHPFLTCLFEYFSIIFEPLNGQWEGATEYTLRQLIDLNVIRH